MYCHSAKGGTPGDQKRAGAELLALCSDGFKSDPNNSLAKDLRSAAQLKKFQHCCWPLDRPKKSETSSCLLIYAQTTGL